MSRFSPGDQVRIRNNTDEIYTIVRPHAPKKSHHAGGYIVRNSKNTTSWVHEDWLEEA